MRTDGLLIGPNQGGALLDEIGNAVFSLDGRSVGILATFGLCQ